MAKFTQVADIEGCYIIKGYVSNDIYSKLRDSIKWRREVSFVFGKAWPQKRLTCFMGDTDKAYSYAKRLRVPVQWNSTVKELSERIANDISLSIGKHPRFTSCLCNYYMDGTNKIDKHSDNTKDLCEGTFIASLSLGERRDFNIYDKKGKLVHSVALGKGDLLLMSREMQYHYTHSVPPDMSVKRGRINLTFRVVDGKPIPKDYNEKDVVAESWEEEKEKLNLKVYRKLEIIFEDE